MGDNNFGNNLPDPLLFGNQGARIAPPQTHKLRMQSEAPRIAGNRADVLATNFNTPKSLLRTFPRKDVFIAPVSNSESGGV
jgi:hypothetical protein